MVGLNRSTVLKERLSGVEGCGQYLAEGLSGVQIWLQMMKWTKRDQLKCYPLRRGLPLHPGFPTQTFHKTLPPRAWWRNSSPYLALPSLLWSNPLCPHPQQHLLNLCWDPSHRNGKNARLTPGPRSMVCKTSFFLLYLHTGIRILS